MDHIQDCLEKANFKVVRCKVTSGGMFSIYENYRYKAVDERQSEMLCIVAGEEANLIVISARADDFVSLYNKNNTPSLIMKEILDLFPLYQERDNSEYYIFFKFTKEIKRYMPIKYHVELINTLYIPFVGEFNIPIELIRYVTLPNLPQWLIDVFNEE